MILVRHIFHAKFGKAAEVVAMLKEGGSEIEEQGGRWRLLTDLSGRYDTVVLEIEAESLAEFERARAEMFADPEFQQDAPRMTELVDWGESEFYTIEE
jgi:hypothetical protein